jgi:hypothetical protein
LSALVNALSILVAAAGVVVAMLVAARTRDVREALRSALELWTAAGALHLAAESAWSAVGSAASIVVIRRLASVSLRRAGFR